MSNFQFRDSEAAERAKVNLDGFELAGRPIKVNQVTDRGDPIGGAMELLDSDNFTAGVGMTQQGRANLMAKLAEGHNAGTCAHAYKLRGICVIFAGLVVPTIPALASQPQSLGLAASTCFTLSNMFDPTTENEPGWENDIRDDVLEECGAFGSVVHIHVDMYSQV